MKRQTKIKLFFQLVLVAGAWFGWAGGAEAYQTQGYLESTDFFVTAGLYTVNKFAYEVEIPAGATLKVQFSYGENQGWYDATGEKNSWTTLADGDNVIDLTNLNWHKDQFYYRLWFASDDGSETPTLSSVSVSYVDFNGTYYTYSTSGTLTSSNLLSGVEAETIDSFDYSAYSIPTTTTMALQFSQDNSTWYDSAGVLDGSDELSIGTATIDLSGLGWSGTSFYYRVVFTSDGTYTPILTEVSFSYNSSIHNQIEGGTIKIEDGGTFRVNNG